jgi:transposase
MATPSLLSQIIACKYQFGLPLYRQETMFSDIGIELSRQTMSSSMLRSAQLLEPLYMRLQGRLLAEPAIHAGETPLKVIKVEKATSHMWVYYCGIDSPSKKINIFYSTITTVVRHNVRLTFLMVIRVTCMLMSIKLMD